MGILKPTIIIVPGSWQQVTAFRSFVSKLENEGFPTIAIKLPSVGSTSGPPLPGLDADIAAVREVVTQTIEKSQEVILLCHSYGGLVGSNAAKGLDVHTRSKQGSLGGIKKIIFLSAFVIPSGKSLFDLLGGQPLPWMDVQGDIVCAKKEKIAEIGFNDLSPEDAAKACLEMTHSSASTFLTPSNFEPWKNGISCDYVSTTEDNAIPHFQQEIMAKQLGPKANSVTLKSGHCAFLSIPDQLLKAIIRLSNM
ncbi:putative hydrolase R7 [Erysiphe necator]|uniref:Putative alpha beta-hydrolase n=1 Tax=Uncinula necator TaxID=52586 RepID=A0A0B1P6L5_UNCNE|nr:putative hydrolase R7 [Erysiphe necator]KHJ33000.1 putative alpha beta-hydrolase [Erysiphe necator]